MHACHSNGIHISSRAIDLLLISTICNVLLQSSLSNLKVSYGVFRFYFLIIQNKITCFGGKVKPSKVFENIENLKANITNISQSFAQNVNEMLNDKLTQFPQLFLNQFALF